MGAVNRSPSLNQFIAISLSDISDTVALKLPNSVLPAAMHAAMWERGCDQAAL
jgi:hypothetical protein